MKRHATACALSIGYLSFLACSPSNSVEFKPDGHDGGTGGTGGSTATGGAHSGGATSSGGSASGGTEPADSSTGGTSTGGSESGGAGGDNTGGRGSGGVGTGGSATGGSATGGAGTGGDNTGGSATGGSATGGAGTGGDNTGGTNTGGTNTGGSSTGGSSTGGSATGGAATGGSGTGGSVDPCASCPSGLCTDAGVCLECASSPADTCSTGSYCSADSHCVQGCKGSGADCASGSCSTGHDCNHCIADSECSAGKVCSAGACQPTCENSGDCSGGRECCAGHCVDTSLDARYCGACDTSCGATDFCAQKQCQPALITSVCLRPSATFLLDGLSVDDAVAAELKTAMEGFCPGPFAARAVGQAESGSINPTTGRPVAGGNELLVVVGGPFGQKLIAQQESSGAAPLYYVYGADKSKLYIRGRDGDPDVLLTEVAGADLTSTQSVFLIEMVRDATSDSLTFVIYGMSAEGTQAGAWFFVNKMLPALPSATREYIVIGWQDTDSTPGPSDGDTFTEVPPP